MSVSKEQMVFCPLPSFNEDEDHSPQVNSVNTDNSSSEKSNRNDDCFLYISMLSDVGKISRCTRRFLFITVSSDLLKFGMNNDTSGSDKDTR